MYKRTSPSCRPSSFAHATQVENLYEKRNFRPIFTVDVHACVLSACLYVCLYVYVLMYAWVCVQVCVCVCMYVYYITAVRSAYNCVYISFQRSGGGGGDFIDVLDTLIYLRNIHKDSPCDDRVVNMSSRPCPWSSPVPVPQPRRVPETPSQSTPYTTSCGNGNLPASLWALSSCWVPPW